ncbi:MAG TPA: hypothetical protein VIV01_01105 [Hyphomicrobiaceae bacterium]
MAMLQRWISAKASAAVDPVRMVQRALADVEGRGLNSMVDALNVIIEERLWQKGRIFETFGEFAVALPPSGLGVRSMPVAKLLRQTLLGSGHFAEWTEVLERTGREPGRPRKNLVNDEGLERFYRISTAATARDRLLLGLKRNHPEAFALVCTFECTPRAAGIGVGLIKSRASSRYGGVCDISAAAALKERAQAKLLCELFGAMSLSAQCTLIARALEPHLDFGLAERWRSRGENSSGS